MNGDDDRATQQAVNTTRPGLYEELRAEAVAQVGESKPLVARYMAIELVNRFIFPPFIREIVAAMLVLAREAGASGAEPEAPDARVA